MKSGTLSQERKVLVTGGSRGIGEAIVYWFLRQTNHHITFTYRRGHQLAAQTVAEAPQRLLAQYLDLNDAQSLASFCQEDLAFDIVVHNAGFSDDAAFYFMTPEQWRGPIDGALNSFYYINKACLGSMIARRWGRVISVVSVSGEAGQRGQTNYSAAKGAVIAASKALAKEVARKGVLVNTVSPGWITTEMTAGTNGQLVRDLVPMGRMGRPEEVAHAVGFLASEGASYINGTTLQVNGGLYT